GLRERGIRGDHPPRQLERAYRRVERLPDLRGDRVGRLARRERLRGLALLAHHLRALGALGGLAGAPLGRSRRIEIEGEEAAARLLDVELAEVRTSLAQLVERARRIADQPRR